jgi:hypothetical protein
MSRRYDVGFCDAYRILKGNYVFRYSLLMFVLCVMDDYSLTIVVAPSVCISS